MKRKKYKGRYRKHMCSTIKHNSKVTAACVEVGRQIIREHFPAMSHYLDMDRLW